MKEGRKNQNIALIESWLMDDRKSAKAMNERKLQEGTYPRSGGINKIMKLRYCRQYLCKTLSYV